MDWQKWLSDLQQTFFFLQYIYEEIIFIFPESYSSYLPAFKTFKKFCSAFIYANTSEPDAETKENKEERNNMDVVSMELVAREGILNLEAIV